MNVDECLHFQSGMFQTGTGHPKKIYVCYLKICFTICLFISPDLDGNRAPH